MDLGDSYGFAFGDDDVGVVHEPVDERTAAIVDRVTLNAHIIETGTDSYRLRTTKSCTRRKTA